jgi:hypothetical protein
MLVLENKYILFYSRVELLHFSHFYHVSLVQWTNCWLPTQGAEVHALGVQPTLLELGLPVSAVLLQW